MDGESNIGDISTIVKMFPLRELVLNRLAKKLWIDFELMVPMSNPDSIIFIEHLVSRRFNLSEFVCERNLYGLPVLLRDSLIEALIWLQRGLTEAQAWEHRCETHLPFTVLNSVTAGSYWAGHFINPIGQFDELAWARHFVADETQPVLQRFKLACSYSIEEDLTNLWNIIEANSELHNEFNSSIWEIDPWCTLWLSNCLLKDMEENSKEMDSFYADGFHEAFSTAHEYTARFMWKNWSLPEKTNFLSNFRCNSLIDAAIDNQARFIQFIYSVLPTKQKRELYTYTAENCLGKHIWFCILQSPFYKVILDDIFAFPHPIPVKFYEKVFSAIIVLIKYLKMPVHKEIFNTLWHHLSPEEKEAISRSNVI